MSRYQDENRVIARTIASAIRDEDPELAKQFDVIADMEGDTSYVSAVHLTRARRAIAAAEHEDPATFALQMSQAFLAVSTEYRNKEIATS